MTATTALPCIWMTAGLVSYRLCDRELDCERCPFDAVMRGGRLPAPPAAAGPASGAIEFPADRLYSTGHTWVAAGSDGRTRLGVDALAAGLLGPPAGIAEVAIGRTLEPGERACELDLGCGAVAVALPLAATVERVNPALRAAPGLVASSPYEEGWLLELRPSSAGDPGELFAAPAAREQAILDLRHFRRQVALHLLAAPEEVGPTLADGGEPLTDLRRVIGPRRYLELLRDIVH
jgi:glycine cleavage system H protein